MDPDAAVAEATHVEPQPPSQLGIVARMPDDCILQIFRFLTPWPDIALAALACRKFYRVSLKAA